MNAIEIRSKFINYFVEHGHIEIRGTSLIQENDSSVLFTTAGMHPLVPYLLGKPHPEGSRLTDYQKCLRTDDIEEVGDEIHMTFFEMLGNWSLGDYFKEESIRMSYEFLTKILKIEPERIAVTIFEGDENIPEDTESENVWKALGIPDNNIFKYGRKHNWWGPAGKTGPCGPDTEIFFDTLKLKCSDDCGPSCKCGKYWEMWNNVFMEYNKEIDGSLTQLKQKNVDTGMGLERITAIVEKKDSIFDTELFCDIVKEIENRAEDNKNTKSIRIIADHLRAACFIVSDGIIPSNTDRGYVLRRLIRRSLRHMNKIGLSTEDIIIADIIIESLNELYPELGENRDRIMNCLMNEKDKFLKTLQTGEKQITRVILKNKEKGIDEIDADTVFRFYETFGFPPEMTQEIAAENNMSVDFNGYKSLYEMHQKKSRYSVNNKFRQK